MPDKPKLLDSTWATAELPFLICVANRFKSVPHRAVDVPEIASDLSWAVEDTVPVALSLADAGYIRVESYRASQQIPFVTVLELAERGRREVGLWPCGDLVAAILGALDQAAEEAHDPDEKSKLQQAGRLLSDVGKGALTSIATALVVNATIGH